MNKIQLIVYMFVLSCLISCYEDKGDYDYRPVNEIVITGIEKEYARLRWAELSVQPQYAFSMAKSEHLTFRWEVDGKVVSREHDLNYEVINHIADDAYKCRFAVTDTLLKTTFYQEFSLKVITPYESGILVLSEQTDKAMLSFRLKGKDSGEFEKWVFHQENNAWLEGRPLSMEQPWSLDNDVCVATSKGNYRLTRQTLKFLKRYDGNTALVKDPDFEMRFCVFTDMVNEEDFGCAIGTNGQIYTFRSYTDFFSTPSLKPVPNYNDATDLLDYDLSDKCLVYTSNYGQTRRFLGYDDREGRYMLFLNRSNVSADVEQFNNAYVRTPTIGLPLLAVGIWDYNKYGSFFYDPETNVAKVVASHNISFQNVTEENVETLPDHKFTPTTILKFCDVTGRAIFSSGRLIYQLNVGDATAEPTILCNKLPENALITCLKLSSDRKRLYVGVWTDRSEEFKGDLYILDAVTGMFLEGPCLGVGGKVIDVIEKQ